MRQILTLLLVLGVSYLNATPKRYYLRQDKNGPNHAFEEIQNLIDDIKVESNNHEKEIRMFEEKLTNQEIAVDTLWKQLNEAAQANKEKMRQIVEQLEAKLSNLEIASNTTASDVEHLKKQVSEAIQQKQKITNLEKVNELQNQNIEHLQAALQALMDALQIKDVALHSAEPYHSLANGPVYHVKAGDSLEKIARKNNTTVVKLKELNHLTDSNDLIIVGQKLRLPD
jgi:LysM repeat protein